jgi:hypothetical protein
MALGRPVDAGVPLSLISHALFPFQRRATVTSTDPCTGARKRAQVRRGLRTGHRSRPIRQGTRPLRGMMLGTQLITPLIGP